MVSNSSSSNETRSGTLLPVTIGVVGLFPAALLLLFAKRLRKRSSRVASVDFAPEDVDFDIEAQKYTINVQDTTLRLNSWADDSTAPPSTRSSMSSRPSLTESFQEFLVQPEAGTPPPTLLTSCSMATSPRMGSSKGTAHCKVAETQTERVDSDGETLVVIATGRAFADVQVGAGKLFADIQVGTDDHVSIGLGLGTDKLSADAQVGTDGDVSIDVGVEALQERITELEVAHRVWMEHAAMAEEDRLSAQHRTELQKDDGPVGMDTEPSQVRIRELEVTNCVSKEYAAMVEEDRLSAQHRTESQMKKDREDLELALAEKLEQERCLRRNLEMKQLLLKETEMERDALRAELGQTAMELELAREETDQLEERCRSCPDSDVQCQQRLRDMEEENHALRIQMDEALAKLEFAEGQSNNALQKTDCATSCIRRTDATCDAPVMPPAMPLQTHRTDANPRSLSAGTNKRRVPAVPMALQDRALLRHAHDHHAALSSLSNSASIMIENIARPLSRERRARHVGDGTFSKAEQRHIENLMNGLIQRLNLAGAVLPANAGQLASDAEQCRAQKWCRVFLFGTCKLQVKLGQACDTEMKEELLVRVGGGFQNFEEFARSHGEAEALRLVLQSKKDNGIVNYVLKSKGTTKNAWASDGFSGDQRAH